MINVPVEFPRWANVGGDIAVPDSARQDIGWVFAQKPPHNEFNWLGLRTFEYLVFEDDRLNLIVDDLGVLLEDVVGSFALASDAAVDANRAVETDHIKDGAVTVPKITGIGDANGIAPLDAGSKVPVANLPDAVTGAMIFIGTWNADTNTPTLADAGVGADQGD